MISSHRLWSRPLCTSPVFKYFTYRILSVQPIGISLLRMSGHLVEIELPLYILAKSVPVLESTISSQGNFNV